MTIVANNYLNESLPHTEVIELITLGFTGKLLQWWNNCLTEGSRKISRMQSKKMRKEPPSLTKA